MPTFAAQVAAQTRLINKALKAAKTLLAAAASLGIDAPKRRRKNKKRSVEKKTPTATPKPPKKAPSPLAKAVKKARDEEDD